MIKHDILVLGYDSAAGLFLHIKPHRVNASIKKVHRLSMRHQARAPAAVPRSWDPTRPHLLSAACTKACQAELLSLPPHP